MSILINGMEMPPNCQNCFASVDESIFCRAAKQYIPMLGKPKFCPLIELPDNGDVVPVVRCKECKHRPTRPKNARGDFDLMYPDDICPLQCGDPWYNQEPDDDWFCANGERSEG